MRMLCLQAFLFVTELRDRDGFVRDCFYDDLREGSGASPIPFLINSHAFVCLFILGTSQS